LVLADESLQHDLHGVELAIAETAHEVDLAEAPNGQTFADFVFFEPSLSQIFQAVERGLLSQHALADRNLVVEQDIVVGGFEAHDLSSFEDRVAVAHVEKVAVYFLMENVR
jgi:hypothetical protein